MIQKHQAADKQTDPAHLAERVRRLFRDQFSIDRLVALSENRALFLSRDLVLNRPVALRIHLKPDTRSRAWFEREVELLARLDHPSLRTIYSAGHREDWSYRVSQWIEGESLAEAVGRGPRPIQAVVQLAFDLAEAVEYAHSKNVIVRRIVPSTVMLDQLGRAVVTDLRFSNKCLDVAGPDHDEMVAPYLAPESRPDKPGDRASDIYTIGTLLYFAVTGEAPNPDPRQITPPQSLRVACPKILQEVIMKSMRPEPSKRYLNCSEIAEELSAHLGGHEFHAPLASSHTTGETRVEYEHRLRRALGDDYELMVELGSGGFGRVYKVRDLRLEREVALKVLHPHLTADRAIADRFAREAQLAARLSHPNIVSIHDIGGRSGLIWYTMAYIEGANMADIVSRTGPQPVDLVVRWLQQSLDALQHAHDQGIVHRDIKPENVLISRLDGSVHIADFGLALAIQVSGIFGGATSRSGTPEFASPEQMLGEKVNQRTDLYSISLVSIFALLGRSPYSGPSVEAILAQQTTQPAPDVSAARSDVPEGLAGVLRRGADADPERRYGSASEYSEALAKCMAGLGSEPARQIRRGVEF